MNYILDVCLLCMHKATVITLVCMHSKGMVIRFVCVLKIACSKFICSTNTTTYLMYSFKNREIFPETALLQSQTPSSTVQLFCESAIFPSAYNRMRNYAHVEGCTLMLFM